MAGFIDSFRDSLQTLTGLPLRSSDLSRPLGLKGSSPTSMPDLNDPSKATVFRVDPTEIRPLESEATFQPTSFSSDIAPAIVTAPTATELGEVMATTAVTPAVQGAPVPAAPKQKAPFIRFIDKVGSFFVHEAPVLEKVAVELEPLMALSPFGPEYSLVVNAIQGTQKTAAASLAVSKDLELTGDQKMALVLQAITPALTKVLESKGVTSGVPDAIKQFAQAVYGLQAGPLALAAASTSSSTPTK